MSTQNNLSSLSREELEQNILREYAKMGLELSQDELDEIIFERNEYIRVESR